MNKKIIGINKWIANYVKKSKKLGIIIGISGGVDSAVLASIGKLNKSFEVHGVWINIESSREDYACAMEVASALKLDLLKFNLTPNYKKLVKNLNLKNKVAKGNLKSRLRMTTLYAIAQEKNLLVASTTNAAEWYMGYFTKHGDNACDIMPLRNCRKEEIFAFGKELNVPKSILERAPSAGLHKGQTDEMDMGFTYSQIDTVLKNGKTPPSIKTKISRYHTASDHKREIPPAPEKTKN